MYRALRSAVPQGSHRRSPSHYHMGGCSAASTVQARDGDRTYTTDITAQDIQHDTAGIPW